MQKWTLQEKLSFMNIFMKIVSAKVHYHLIERECAAAIVD